MRIRQAAQGAKGSVAIISAFYLVVMIGVLGLAIDLGHLYVVKSELQRAADAGALAGAGALLAIPEGTQSPTLVSADCNRAMAAAQTIVGANKADGVPLELLADDISLGQWDSSANTFNPTGCSLPYLVSGIRVTVRKDDTANGPVPLYFAGVLPGGWRSKNLTAQATALVGFAGSAPVGVGTFPLAIDSDKVRQYLNGDLITIHLNPTTGDDGCWHTFDDKSPGASDLRGLVNGSIDSPAVKVGDFIKPKEGVAESVLKELQSELDKRGGAWDVFLPVIPPDSHTGWAEVLGFAGFKITGTGKDNGKKFVQGYSIPFNVARGVSPGGPNYGLWAGVPKMVQ